MPKLPSKKFMALVVLLIILNILDICLTVMILRYGGLETNSPWLYFNTTGIRLIDCVVKISLSILMGVLSFVTYWIALRENSRIGFIGSYVILIALNLFYFWVVISNTQVLVWQMAEWRRVYE